jgi:hypothetical protein
MWLSRFIEERLPRSATPQRTDKPVPKRGGIITRTCSRCGSMEKCPARGIPADWSIATEGERVEFICVRCVRANLRAIEGKLPQEYREY